MHRPRTWFAKIPHRCASAFTAALKDAILRLVAAGARVPDDPARRAAWLERLGTCHWPRVQAMLARMKFGAP